MMKKKLINCLLLTVIWSVVTYAQTYQDHFGTGNNVGISTTSSPVQNSDSSQSILSGTGYIVDTIGATRFLAQAGFGGSIEDIDTLLQLGIENWLDWQMTMPYESHYDRFTTIADDVIAGMYNTTNYQNGANPSTTRYTGYTSMAFYDKIINDKDVLRQKAAFALSQIFVVEMVTVQERARQGEGYAKYYDILYEGAFGNFRDILEQVTLSPVMGDYLTYFRNKKADTNLNTQPDENYAREIMQLFTIGLYELNNDGTRKIDECGNNIPTYNNNDIQELAKVFTGLYGAALHTFYATSSNPTYNFDRPNYVYDWSLPMVMDSSHHDNGIKTLPDGTIISAGQDGILDIEIALDWLFEHDNVGPFIARRLIQQLVKSNPTPGYINRVATVFNNNGAGVRGDMGAVFKAILLDPEARVCEWITDPHNGRLLQPMERNINLFKTFGVSTPSGKFRFIDYAKGIYSQGEEPFVIQAFLQSPSVFNFFSPFYAESEFVDSANLVSPEFQILNSVTSIHSLNRTRDIIERMGRWNGTPFINPASMNRIYTCSPFMNISGYGPLNGGASIQPQFNSSDSPELDFQEEVCKCENEGYEALLDHLDIVLCRGQLSTETKNKILNNIQEQLTRVQDFETENVGIGSYRFTNPRLDYNCLDDTYQFNCLRIVKEMVYFIMISPDYAILK